MPIAGGSSPRPQGGSRCCGSPSGGFAVLYLAAAQTSLAATGFADWQFEPVGVVAPFDTPLPPAAVRGLYLAAIGSGVAFTAGWRFRVSGPAFAVLLLWVTSYQNSWG